MTYFDVLMMLTYVIISLLGGVVTYTAPRGKGNYAYKTLDWDLFNNYAKLSCFYVKFPWLIPHGQLSFQPLPVNVTRRLADSRGDAAVPVRI